MLWIHPPQPLREVGPGWQDRLVPLNTFTEIDDEWTFGARKSVGNRARCRNRSKDSSATTPSLATHQNTNEDRRMTYSLTLRKATKFDSDSVDLPFLEEKTSINANEFKVPWPV